MRLRHLITRLFFGGFAGALLSMNVAAAKTFTGAFQGQGEACWGNLFIRTKTLEWDTDYSICRGPYTIIAQHYTATPHENYDFIIYKMDRVNRKCRYPYIGLYFYRYFDEPGIHNDWDVAGFPTFQDYKTFDIRPRLSGHYSDSLEFERILFCSLPIYGDT